jgi:hypothetical protein
MSKEPTRGAKEVGLVNPKLYSALGKNLLLAFFQTDRLRMAEESLLATHGLSAYQLMGFWDLLVMHLGDRYTLSFKLGNSYLYLDNEVIFSVTDFIKFQRKDVRSIPYPKMTLSTSDERLAQIAILSKDWGAHSDQVKAELVQSNLILGSLTIESLSRKRFRHSIILIRLPDPNVAVHTIFQNFIIQQFDVFQGLRTFAKGESTPGYNYMIEVVDNPYVRDKFVDRVHKWGFESKVNLRTSTLEMQQEIVDDFLMGLQEPSTTTPALELLKELERLGLKISELPVRINEITSYITSNRTTLERLNDDHLRNFLEHNLVLMGTAMASESIDKYETPLCNTVEWIKMQIINMLLQIYGTEESQLRHMQEELNLKHPKVNIWTFGDALDAFLKYQREAKRPLTKREEQILTNVNDYRNALVHRRYSDIDSIRALEEHFSGLLSFIVKHERILLSQKMEPDISPQ